jgi:hypothetical protein
MTGATNATLTLTSISPSNSGTYSVLVSNTFGAVLSSNATLTILPSTVSTLSADWGISDAILAGSVSTGSNSTFVWFNWGVDTNYGNATPAYPVPDGAVSLNFSNRITGLPPHTGYHYQAVASNALGVVLGSDASFTTAQRFVPITGTNGVWGSLAWSADGGKMYAVSGQTLFLSTDAGTVWTPISDAGFSAVVVSADGMKVAAISGSLFYFSTNSGATWRTNSTPVAFSLFNTTGEGNPLAASADLNTLIAVDGSQASLIWISTNAGVTWQPSGAPAAWWVSLASSADGSELLAADIPDDYSERLYKSTNLGTNWAVANGVGAVFYKGGVYCSANGSAIVFTSDISGVSTNAGASWRGIGGGETAACSSNGTTIAFVQGNNTVGERLYISQDSGASWYLANAPEGYPQLPLVSSDGTKLALLNGSTIFLSEAVIPAPTLNVTVSNSNLLLSWMVPTTNFILQQSFDLVNWATVTNVPILNITNLQNQVILPFSQSQSFYRLKTTN